MMTDIFLFAFHHTWTGLINKFHIYNMVHITINEGNVTINKGGTCTICRTFLNEIKCRKNYKTFENFMIDSRKNNLD